MEKFLILFGGEDLSTRSPQEMQDYLQLWLNWLRLLKEQHIHVFGEPLESYGKQITGSNKTISDNTFFKENISGFIIIQAESFEKAVKVAEGSPVLTVDGKLEIRHILNNEINDNKYFQDASCNCNIEWMRKC